MLSGKNIIVGVTGGIAAYKAVEVVSRLKKAGCCVYVIMTKGAANFVTPLTFREISGNPVVSDMWAEPKTWNVEHIALANRADMVLVAPATANFIGKVAAGIADDMLSTTVMATTAPVIIAPAMNTNMYLNPVVQENIKKLTGLGFSFIEPDNGILACGVEGPGRLPEPAAIVEKVVEHFRATQTLAGRKVIVTAGGTREPIDPVRYIGNRSSGKMGYALAKAARARGAEVILISAPTSLPCPSGVVLRKVETAMDMREAVLSEYADADIVLKAAAVADYRLEAPAEHKMKKISDKLTLVLERNPDILSELGKLKKHQFLVGFAAETQDLTGNAAEKLQRKNLDMIVANDVTAPGAGFNVDTNIARILYRDNRIEELPQMSKEMMANIIIDRVCENEIKK